ncbi:MAG: hypothetical protein HY827_03545 [Actinobacteria bacterium]|nr:hypothetical protein [Actinomycetota bacterium]
MPDMNWINQLREELVGSANRLNSQSAHGKARRKTVAVVLAVLLLPGVALAATQPWDSSPPEPAPGAGIVADFDEAVVDSPAARNEQPDTITSAVKPCAPVYRTVSGPAPEALVSELAVLRDTPAGDAERNAYRFRSGTVYIDHQTVVHARDGRSYAVTAVSNDGMDPCSPGPRGFQVCVSELKNANGTELCARIGQVRAGKAFAFADDMPGGRAGLAQAIGVVPDGIHEVRYESHPDAQPASQGTATVTDNIVTFEYNGSATVPPRISMIH